MSTQTASFVVAALAVCSLALGQDGDRAAALRQYAVLAENLVPGLSDGSPVAQPNMEPAALEAKERWRVITLEEIDASNRRIRGVAKEAAAANRQFLDAATKTGDADAIAALAMAVVRGSAFSLIRNLSSESSRQDQYSASVKSRRAVTFLLPELARELAGPAHSKAAVEIDFDENWYGAEPDRVNLTNVSGVDLTNCTLQVDLRGREGAWVRNVHFVPAWPAGKKLWADYHTSDPSNVSAISRTTAVEVQELRVSLWAAELSKEGESINYPGKDRDADRLRQIDRLVTFTIDYVESPLFETGPCLGVTLGGVEKLPSCKVEVTCHGGNKVDQVLEYEVARWSNGRRISLNSRGALRSCPDTFDVAVKLSGVEVPLVKKGLVAKTQR